MDRAQAHRLWLATLALPGVPRGAAGDPAGLRALWAAADLDPKWQERLIAALGEPDDLARRTALVRGTGVALRAAGFDPPLLTTPAAPMRGL